MELLVIFGIWMLNLGISIWNNVVTGRAWVECRHAGGWHRFMAWIGYLITSLGYTWNLIILVALVLLYKGTITEEEAGALLSLGYLTVLPGFLFGGYAVMLNSWQQVYRERSLANAGIAAWNTYANIHNTYHAVKGTGQAMSAVAKVFSKKDGAKALLVLVVIACALAGFTIAAVVVWRIAGNDDPLPER